MSDSKSELLNYEWQLLQPPRNNVDKHYLHSSLKSRVLFIKMFALSVIAMNLFILASYRSLFDIMFISGTGTPSFEHLASHCADIEPIGSEEHLTRQQALAETLYALNASAYVAEPGTNAQFFGNLSTGKWFLSERPLLLIIAPEVNSDGKVKARISVLTPAFEATRARSLPIPSQENITFLEWAEEADPYEIAIPAFTGSQGTVYVDGSIRKFIVDGLESTLPNSAVLSAPLEIRSLRERKSSAELDIIRCVNEVTLLAIRAVREELYFGITESEAQGLIRNALLAAGLSDPFVLGLFGENAALPHGSGSDRVLGKEDFVLFDVGGTLHGYHSDITRTFALKGSTIPSEHLKVWFTVHAGQTAALHAAKNGSLTRQVDEAARAVISAAGYGKYFTHRLGHGLGLETHEEPYLRGGSADIIRSGHVFTDEPGVYIEGKLGVRHEDTFYVSENGTAVLLTEAVGGQAKSPWFP